MSPTRNPVGATQERLARVMPGFLRRSLELRMVFAATAIGLLLIALLLTFVTDRIRSEVFEDQKDAILVDARQRVSVAQAEFDSTTGVATVDEVNAEVQDQVNSIKDSISASGGIGHRRHHGAQPQRDLGDGGQRPEVGHQPHLPHLR